MSNDFHTATEIKKARGIHVCEQCGTKIDVGSSYRRVTGRYDGEFFSYGIHTECWVAANEYAKAHDLWGEEYPWFQHFDGAYHDDLKWCCERHPLVAARLGWDVKLAEWDRDMAEEPVA